MAEACPTTRLIAEYNLAMADPLLDEETKAQLAADYVSACESVDTPRWIPNSGPQSAAYISQADELFYGGSAGGGKSLLLLGLALTAHTRSLILRFEGTQLAGFKDELVKMTLPNERGLTNVGNGGVFRTYDDRLIELLGCDDQRRASALQGRPHDAKLWDEVGHFSPKVFRFVNGWNRTTIKGQRCRVVAAGNPPLRAEEEWILKYWGPWLDDQHPMYPHPPGDLCWFTTVDGQDEQVADSSPVKITYRGKTSVVKPLSRTFIPARLEDNPFLSSTDYGSRLAGLEEPMRSQLLFGDMQIGRLDHPHQLIPTSWVSRSMKKDWKPTGGDGVRLTVAALDCAQEGADNAALAKRYRNWIAPIRVWPGKDIHSGDDIVSKVSVCLEHVHMPLLIDVLATPGGAAVQAFRTHLPKLTVWAINFGNKSSYLDKTGRLEMGNLRAEAYWRIREALDPSLGPPETRLQLPDDPLLAAELCSVRFKPEMGYIQLEKKEEIIKRIGRSPDRADAVAMTMLADRPPDGGWLPASKPEQGNGGFLNPFKYGSGGFMGTR